MSNVGYDLDTSGGLMPLIRALIKPPDEEISTQKPKKAHHPYYKRPGKGHNHDSCDACGEGGDLICCDRCPASFHLGCYDPPLDENDIPAGLWLCKECCGSDEKQASTRSSRAQSPSDNKSDTDKKTRSQRNSRANSLSKKKKDDKEEVDIKKELEPEHELSPMEILVKAAKVMNPKQFELPREMKIPCIFPGTEKEGNGKNGNGVVSVDAWGCVPLPAKSCFVCRATCKLAPLLQCDYCPLLFHQDCLDPPLTALPTGRWMCPNHVEQYIDWKVVRSISATERAALWERFSGPVDQHAVKVDFIRRARNPRPAFRVKVPVGMRGRVVVPRMVRLHYRRPPPLLPSRREHVRCEKVLKHLKAGGSYEDSEDEDVTQICMNLSCPEYTGEGKCPLQTPKLKGATKKDADEDLKAIEENEPKLERNSDSSDFSDSDFEHLTTSVKKRKVSQSEDKSPGKRGPKPQRLELCAEEGVEELLATVEEQLQKLDERLIKLLAWQRLQQVAAGEAGAGRWRRSGTGTWGTRAASALRGATRARLAKLGVRRLPLPSELLPRADRERIAAVVWGPAPPPAPTPVPKPPHPALDLADALVKAALCELKPPARNGGEAALGRAIPMRLSALSVGSDGACDVVLDSRCRRVSPRHAIIFCDEVTRHFELINYSEWGTRVNGVLYACDLSHGEGATGDATDDAESRAQALRQVVRSRRTKPPRLNGSLTVAVEEEMDCKCPGAPPPASAAWEGSALVPHGALLQFGCRMYVFSITDHQTFPHQPEVDEPAL
ncbi:PHD finger protein 12 [Pararge aegeria]|nr:PHD finger protein 12 [Pararge aegeria]